MKYDMTEVEEAKKRLGEILKPGDTVYTAMSHVSRSGMMRHIRLFKCSGDEVLPLDWYVSRVLGWPLADGGVKVSGCGMDMGFHVVMQLSYALFAKSGYDCLGDKCPSSDHVNRVDPMPKHHNDGYALRQRWL